MFICVRYGASGMSSTRRIPIRASRIYWKKRLRLTPSMARSSEQRQEGNDEILLIQPEVAGGLGENTVMDRRVHPPIVSKLHYEFDGWGGDALLTSFPYFIVTEDAKKKLQSVGLTGMRFDKVEVTTSELFQELFPDRQLPHFVWLKVDGKPGESGAVEHSTKTSVSMDIVSPQEMEEVMMRCFLQLRQALSLRRECRNSGLRYRGLRPELPKGCHLTVGLGVTLRSQALCTRAKRATHSRKPF